MKEMRPEDRILETVRRIHMIGIGGSGMCPLAEILHSLGYELTGSDNNESDPLKRVKNLGIPVFLGHKAEQIGGAQLVVYSAAIAQDNPELVAAKAAGIPTMERSHLLGALTRRFDDCIGVCGTHGKTTVSSMLTQILILCGADPTAVIGGKLPLIDANGRVGKSQHMVCESCEFVDTFLQMTPDVAVLLNIDNDHLDYFGTMDNLVASFRKFLSMASKIVINGDDKLVQKAAKDLPARRITFGLEAENDYTAANITRGRIGFCFDVVRRGENITRLELAIPGRHNIYNALAAFATAYDMGLPAEGIRDSILSFHGAGRRFEMLGEFGGILLADDYAHHPTELRATLTAAKELAKGKVIAVFQPFTFSRTALLKDDFIEALHLADQVILTPIMGSREQNTYGISSEDLAAPLKNASVELDFESVARAAVESARPGDLILTMGGGDIYKAAYMMRDLLKSCG